MPLFILSFIFFITILLLSLTPYIRPSSSIAHTLDDVSSSPTPPFPSLSLPHPPSYPRTFLYFPTLLPHARSRPRPPPHPRSRTPSTPYRVLLVELYAPHPSDRSHIHRTITLPSRLPPFPPFQPPGQLLSDSSCVIDVRRCIGLQRRFLCLRHLIATGGGVKGESRAHATYVHLLIVRYVLLLLTTRAYPQQKQ